MLFSRLQLFNNMMNSILLHITYYIKHEAVITSNYIVALSNATLHVYMYKWFYVEHHINVLY